MPAEDAVWAHMQIHSVDPDTARYWVKFAIASIRHPAIRRNNHY